VEKTRGTVPTNISSYLRQIKLSPNKYLFPIFETVVNSIQAIKEAKEVEGKIEITVQRANPQLTTDGSKPVAPNIIGFVIQDNGIGFDEDNYSSFEELASEHKLEFGCKGIGRFMALAVFASIYIESTFKSKNDGKFYHRKIAFNESDGVKQISLEPVQETKTKTVIKLSSVRTKYIHHNSPDDIASSLLLHLLIYYITESAPQVTIFDAASDTSISLSDVFATNINFDGVIEEIEPKNNKFRLYFLKSYFKNYHKHLIHYCAHDREVEEVSISELVTDLINERIEEDGKSYYIAVFVVSNYLNDNVNDFRNEFFFPKKAKDTENLHYPLSLEDINIAVAEKIKERFSVVLNKMEEAKFKDIETSIYNEWLEYTPLLEHKEFLRNIKPYIKGQELELALHKASNELSYQQKARVIKFLNQRPEQITNKDEYKEFLRELLRDQNDIGKSELVKYMFHRKAVLKVFEKFLDIQKSGNFMSEGDIHDIIFERKKSSNEISFNDHNLWILDERVAYKDYIASDLPVENLRPDIFIYDTKFTYGDPKEYIVIFELKKPGRTSYSNDEKDLGKQIKKQVMDIVSNGGGKSAKGRNLNITASTPKYGYVIADMDNDMMERLKLEGYKITPKGSFFKYEDGITLMIEILTYDQLLNDANARHKAFFKHLGIDSL
jgi:hypothetical protein